MKKKTTLDKAQKQKEARHLWFCLIWYCYYLFSVFCCPSNWFWQTRSILKKKKKMTLMFPQCSVLWMGTSNSGSLHLPGWLSEQIKPNQTKTEPITHHRVQSHDQHTLLEAAWSEWSQSCCFSLSASGDGNGKSSCLNFLMGMGSDTWKKKEERFSFPK